MREKKTKIPKQREKSENYVYSFQDTLPHKHGFECDNKNKIFVYICPCHLFFSFLLLFMFILLLFLSFIKNQLGINMKI